MKNLIIASLSSLVLAACGTTDHISTSSDSSAVQAHSLQEINWNKISVPYDMNFLFTAESQKAVLPEFEGPVAGFSFAYDGYPVQIEITSPFKSLSGFVPNLALYDQDFKLIKSFSAEQFDYDRDDFVKGEVMHGEVLLNLPLSTSYVYGVVYTTAEDAEGTTTLIHPAKAFAIAKRTEPPRIDDPVATHSLTGQVSVSVSKINSGVFEKKNVLPVLSNVPVQEKKAPLNVDVQPETRKFYLDAITKAVEESDIPKALSLLDEAKALNVEGAQEVFVKALNNR